MRTEIEGQKIVKVRQMTNEELSAEGWDKDNFHNPIALELENGTVLYPSRDDEGNGYGVIFGVNKDKTAFQI